MAKKQTQKPIPHKREVALRGEDLETYIETRGLRSLYYGDAIKPPFSKSEDPTNQAKLLALAARELLHRKGEKTLDDVLAEAKRYKRDDIAAVGKWKADLAERFGFLSPVFLAAQFTCEQHKLATLLLKALSPNSKQSEIPPEASARFQEAVAQIFPVVYNFCDVWHWWRTEFHDEHDALLQARSTQIARNKGAQSNQMKKEKRDKIIAEELARFTKGKDSERSPPSIGQKISYAVNTRCRAGNLGPISTDQITRTVRKLMQVR